MDQNARMNAQMNETLNISGALLAKVFGRQRMEVERFRERAAGVRDIGVRQAVVGRWFFLGLSLVSALGTALVFWVGGHLVLRGAFTVGTIVAFSAYLVEPVRAADGADQRPGRLRHVDGQLRAGVRGARPAGGDRRPAEGDRPEPGRRPRALRRRVVLVPARRRAAPGGWRRCAGSAGTRATDYPPATARTPSASAGTEEGPIRYALRDISFEIRPGQLAALVGPSGAGKTTVTYLLPRLYDPTQGAVRLDGHDLRDLTQESLARQIGMVTQETYLFHDTLRNNLLYARRQATHAELEAACRAANIHDFIAGLPDGYETLVGERGYRLSGGEKQRVAIARVILKDPRVLILDEATSHLDSQSEALIQQAMELVMRGRTSLVIAHRLSTVIGADLILVMDGGTAGGAGNARRTSDARRPVRPAVRDAVRSSGRARSAAASELARTSQRAGKAGEARCPHPGCLACTR